MNDATRYKDGPHLAENSQAEKVFKLLRLDDWMGREMIAHFTDIKESGISSIISSLRATGWVESRRVGPREWEHRRRAEWGEPQPKIVNRGKHRKKEAPVVEPTVAEHLELARYHINQAMENVADIEAAQDALAKIRRSTRELF